MPEARDIILGSLRPHMTASDRGEGLGLSALEPSADWDSIATAITPLNGGVVVAKDAESFPARLQAMLDTLGVKSAICWDHPLLRKLGVAGILKRCGVEELRVAPEGVEEATGQRFCPRLSDVDLGITSADAVFVNAGTVVVMAGEGRPRSVSLAPPMHLAIVPRSALYRDLSSLPQLLRDYMDANGRMPSGLHMITGASSTADIEQQLVRGVHGPGQIRVLGVDFQL